MTIGAGAVAAILTRAEAAPENAPKLLGGVVNTNSAANKLCEGGNDGENLAMKTDSEKLLEAGISLAAGTWKNFKNELGWNEKTPNHVITHQVGSRHTSALFEKLGLDRTKDFQSFERLGNVGSVSLPITLALAIDSGTIKRGEKVALLGIGSGLSSAMLGVQF